MDLGGDKLSHVLEVPPEANPFLGWRGIRICLDTPDLFKTQLRALLRAGAHGEAQILLPMISSLNELRRIRVLVEEAKDELRAAGHSFAEHCKLGIMVEVPSVALMADHFAGEADFFSLGTNDLTQYALAVDRGMSKVAWLYDPFHPAVLRLIKMVADSGQRTNTPVSICGEMAGDPLWPRRSCSVLGLDCLSLSPVSSRKSRRSFALFTRKRRGGSPMNAWPWTLEPRCASTWEMPSASTYPSGVRGITEGA